MGEQIIIAVCGDRVSRLLLIALFNHCGVDAGRMAISAADTTFTYQIESKTKLTKKQLEQVRIFASGFVACWKALQ